MSASLCTVRLLELTDRYVVVRGVRRRRIFHFLPLGVDTSALWGRHGETFGRAGRTTPDERGYRWECIIQS